MAKFYDAQKDHLEGIMKVREQLSNPHHRAILANYAEHVALEQCGRWPELFERDLLVEHPLYQENLSSPNTVTTHEGRDAVGAFYDSIGDEVFAMVNERLAVDDWGLASFSDIFEFVTGETAATRGYDVADPAAWYTLFVPQTMFWLYDDSAKLIGERLFWVAKPVLREADQDDILTQARINESCEEFLEAIAVGT
jgi:hypothetical protein